MRGEKKRGVTATKGGVTPAQISFLSVISRVKGRSFLEQLLYFFQQDLRSDWLFHKIVHG